MVSVYSGIDMLCLSSVSEGSPNVVAEAMACGTPCVVAEAGGAPEIVGELGRVVPQGAPELLAEGIEEMSKRLPAIDRDALRHAIETRFTLDGHVRAMESLYGELLSACP
jgi:glycosyltransferase involved in cell wall biosynthesis